MSATLRKLSTWIVNSPYLSRWVVLLIDTIVSVFATLSVYLVLGFFIRSQAPVSTYGFIALASMAVSTGIFMLFGTYRGIMRHTTMQEVWRILLAVISKSAGLLLIFALFYDAFGFSLSILKIAIAQLCDVVCSLSMLVTLRVLLIYVYELFMTSINKTSKRILIYGDDSKSLSLASYLSKNQYTEYRVMGYIKVQDMRSKLKLQGLTVYTIDAYDYFVNLITKKNVNAM